MERRLTLLSLLIALVALTGGSALAANTVTVFDDGDNTYDYYFDEELQTTVSYATYVGDDANNWQYDLGGAGRPASGTSYSGHEYLTLWGDLRRGTARGATRLAGFVRNDVGLDMSANWGIRLVFANDFVKPDYNFRMFLMGDDVQPDAALLNSGNIRDRMTLGWATGDQLEPPELQWDGFDGRGGYGCEVWAAGGVLSGLDLSPRLDPRPEYLRLRGGKNYLTILWNAADQRYYLNIANEPNYDQVPVNEEVGVRHASIAASALQNHPQNTWFAAGTTDNGIWQASGWTIYDITYGRDVVPEPGSLLALGMGLTGLLGFARRRR